MNTMNKLTKILVGLLTLLLPFISKAPLSAMAQTKSGAKTKSANLIVPGRSVGKLNIGDGRSAVLAKIGKPSKSAKWKSGPTQDTWFGKGSVGDPDYPEREQLNVIYIGGKVVQIEFNSPKFHTSAGISAASTLRKFLRTYKGVKARALGYGGDLGSYEIYYDAVKSGIAFSMGKTQDVVLDSFTPSFVRVHRRGVTVLPDPGGEPMAKPDDSPR